MRSTPAILALAEGIELLSDATSFRRSVPAGRRGVATLHFISYSSVDGEVFAHRLCGALRRHDPPFEVFIDNDLSPGERWTAELEDAISQCESFLFVMTRDSVGKESFCAKELAFAFRNRVHIIPLQLHRDTELPLLASDLQSLEVSEDLEGLEVLLDKLQWMRSPEGRIRDLSDQLAYARRELARAAPEAAPRWRDRIAVLERRLAAAKRDADPAEAERRAADRISHDQALDRQEGVAPPAKRRPKVVNDAPRYVPDYFQDRHHETARLEEYLRNDAVRLVVVSGPEDLGKTAMVCRLLDAIVGDQPLENGPIELDGVVYLSVDERLVSARDILAGLGALLPDGVAAKLLELVRDPESLLDRQLDTVLEALAGRRVVVLLDAAQDLIDAATQRVTDADLDRLIRRLLDPTRSHGVKTIVTTRRRPESLMSIHRSAQRHLALDEGLSSPHAENLLRALDSDGKAGLRYASDDQLDAVRRRTSGNPFALEMLHSLLKNDPSTSLAQLLADCEGLPPAEVVDGFLARQAVVVLDTMERAVVEALAIYEVPVRPGAVDYLLQPHVPGMDSGPVLRHLTETKLLREKEGFYQLPAKYWGHALGRVAVGDPGDADSVHQYTQLALFRRAASYFEEVSAPPELWRKLEDLRALLYRFRLLIRGEDYEQAAELLSDISPHLLRWGHGREVLEGHQGLVGKLHDPDKAQENMGRLGIILFDLGRYEEAIDRYRQAIELCEPLEDPTVANRWVLNEGSAYYQLGQTDRAFDSYRRAQQIAEDAGQPDEKRWALAGIALCESDTGRFDLAIQHSQEALELARDAGESELEIDLLAYLGNFHGQMGRHEQATVQLNRALGRARGEGYLHAEIQCLIDLAELRVDEGEFSEAVKLARAALEANKDYGETQLAREAGYLLALAYLCDRAEPEARMAIDQACQHQPRRWTQPALALQGIVQLRQHDPNGAGTAFQTAIAEAEALLKGGRGCFFALDALALGNLGQMACGGEGSLLAVAASFSEARTLTRVDGVVQRVQRLLDQLALAGQSALVDSVRPYAAGTASSPPPGGATTDARRPTSREPAA